MIITKSPMRISLGGGGTDLASYYREHGGFLISAAIDKYVYITIHKSFSESGWLKYSSYECVRDVDEIRHPIFREALKQVGVDPLGLEIASLADIPAGTGLGSSGSFTTALLKALHQYHGDIIGMRELAEEACAIEIDRLKEHIGKQDQYIASYGGIVGMTIQKDGYVQVEPLVISNETLYNLEDNLALFFTGFSHSASNVLQDQDKKSQEKDSDMLNNLHRVKQMGYDSKTALERGDLNTFAEIMNTHWQNKRKRSAGMSNPKIDEWYEYALQNGALGGKLIGAGGGGFLLFYCADKVRLRDAMKKVGLMEVRFRFDEHGTRVVL